MNPVYDPSEDYNESMCYTDPRGETKFRHYAEHTDQYSYAVPDPHPYWWAVPIICAASALMVLVAFRSG